MGTDPKRSTAMLRGFQIMYGGTGKIPPDSPTPLTKAEAREWVERFWRDYPHLRPGRMTMARTKMPDKRDLEMLDERIRYLDPAELTDDDMVLIRAVVKAAREEAAEKDE